MSLIKEVLLGLAVIVLTSILIAAALAFYAFNYSTHGPL